MDDQDLRRELRLTQERLRTVLDSAADVVLLVDTEGRLLSTSTRGAELLGYESEADLEPVLEYVHPDDRPAIEAALGAAVTAPGPVPSFECRVRHADGSWREMEGSGTNLLASPDVAALVIGLRDMTERRAMERMFLRLHRLNTLLAEANEAALHATDATGLLGDACRIAVEHGGLAAAWAAVREGDDLVPVAAFGHDQAALDEMLASWSGPVPPGGRATRVLATGEALVVDDIADPAASDVSDAWRPVVLAFGLRSSLHLPLVVDGEVAGVVAVYAPQPGWFDDAARALLERLGRNVAFGLAALEASRRRDTSELALARRTRQQAAVAKLGELALAAADPGEVAEAAVHAIVTGVGSTLATVLELEPGGTAFRVVAGTGWRHGFVGSVLPIEEALPSAWVLEHRAPLVVEDYAREDRFPRADGLLDEGAAAGVLVPVDVDGRTWGTVAMHSPTSRGFDPEDVSFLQSVANVLAAAVARDEAFSRLRHQALHDPLTGLPNRILLEDRLEQALERARRSEGSVVVAVLDVDGFRLVNDTLGPAAGDDLLRAVAQRLAHTVRPGDTLARLAADEFALVSDSGCPVAPADAIRAALTEPIEVAGRPLVVTVSTGSATVGDRTASGAEVLQRALSALHLAKSEGRARHRSHDEGLEAELAARFDLQSDLTQAVDRDELELAYQPIVDTASGAVVGTEALLRWNHPGRGVVSPAEFIPLAEETGLIVPIGAWVLAEACRTTAPWARWAEQTGRPFHVSVNLSAVQLQDPELVDHVAACLRRNGMDPATLRLEITESVLFSERDASTSILRSLHDLGVGLVVDDFGTGYSSLAYLQRFPLQALKIDRSFTSKLGGDDEHTAAIVEAITSMAAALDLETVAEGVEEEEQREVLVRLGCSHSQGWLFGRPVPSGDFERVLHASAPSPRRARVSPGRTPAEARGQGIDEGAFRSLLDAVPDVVATFDRDLRHVYVNAAAERASGRTRSELLGRTNAELGMPAANVRQWDAAIRAVFITGRPLDIDFRHDGRRGTRWYASRLVPEVVDGRVVSVSAVTRDVTEENVAASMREPVLDARTGVLARAPFLRLAGDLRHEPDSAFAVVVAAFDTDVPPGAGAALRSVVGAGDVTARWSAGELVVLRHPVTADDANALRAAVAGALARYGADVDVRLSSGDAPRPSDLLDHWTRLARLA